MENRDTFFERFNNQPFCHLFTRTDLRRIELMYVLSKYGHRGQKRKAPVGDTPARYFEHPRAVALILIDELRLADPETIILALGHDLDEDSTQVTADLVEEALGEVCAKNLRMLSKRGKTSESYLYILEHYADWRTLITKGADRLHNLRTLPPDETFKAKQIKETREKYRPIFARMVAIAPAGVHGQAVLLRDEIEYLIQG